MNTEPLTPDQQRALLGELRGVTGVVVEPFILYAAAVSNAELAFTRQEQANADAETALCYCEQCVYLRTIYPGDELPTRRKLRIMRTKPRQWRPTYRLTVEEAGRLNWQDWEQLLWPDYYGKENKPMERKLASIQRVLALDPIPGADRIEKATIQGWQVVVQKGRFAPGDLAVFLEIDSVPPDEPVFQFLWQSKNMQPGDEPRPRPDKYRIRTTKLKGTLSQGILFTLDEVLVTNVAEGEDVTALLGVTKYDPPILASGLARAAFPYCVPKTDEMRVQSFPAVLDELRGHPYVATLKYDGTSSTFLIDPRDGDFHVCSRNFSVKNEGGNVYWKMAEAYGIEAILRQHPTLAIQGEIIGPGIQGNKLMGSVLQLVVFNVYDHHNLRYFDHAELQDFCAEHHLIVAETIELGESFHHDLASMLLAAEGTYPGTRNEREGLVIRPQTEMYSATLAGRLSFKAISNPFLLKEGE